MPFARPTLSELRADVAATIGSSLDSANVLLRFSPEQILGRVQADLVHGNYGYLDWIAKQAVPFTATGEHLQGWAALKKVFLKDATSASGTGKFSGTIGKIIPAATEVTRNDGVLYTTLADATVDGTGYAYPALLAQYAGVVGNADVGTPLRLGEAVDGVNNAGVVLSACIGGADVEEIEPFRSRMLEVYRNPPQGGAYADYVEWAKAVPGITRAWVKPQGYGIGTVVVYVMLDGAEAAYDGFPQGTDGVASAETRASPATGDQLTVANALYPLRPVTALVYIVAPIADPKNFTIAGLSGASSATKAAISAAITSVFQAYGAPGGALDADGNAGGLVDLSYIETAIAAISGTPGFVITSPVANITCTAGKIPTLGTITWA